MEKFITDEIQSEAIADLAKIVSVPSYNEPAQPKAPFGKVLKKLWMKCWLSLKN